MADQKLKEGSLAQSKLIRLLSSFSSKEFREFEKFVHSPAHNNRNDVSRFFTEIKRFYPSFSSSNFTKENIYSKLYPKNKYRDDTIRRLASNLLKTAEEYISYMMFKNDRFNYDKYALDYFFSKKMDMFFWKQLDKTEGFLESRKIRNAEYFYRTALITEARDYYLSQVDVSREKADLQKQIDSVWGYCVITLLRLYGVGINDNNYFNKNYDLKFLEPLLGILKDPGFPDSKAAEMYLAGLELIKNISDDAAFLRLKELLDKNFDVLEKWESFNLYAAIQNHLFIRSLDPKCDVTGIDFEITDKMLKLGLLTEKGWITSEWFVTVFLKAIRAGEIRYAEKFIDDYKLKLFKNERENILNYTRSELAIAKGEFEKALGFLAKTKFNNVHEKLRVNHMYIKIYYETGMSESFFYSVESFRHIIKDFKSISEGIRVLYENFIKYVTKLYKIKINESDIPLELLKQEIINAQIIGNKWVIEKVKELESK